MAVDAPPAAVLPGLQAVEDPDIQLVDRYRAHKLAEREEIREALAAGADLP